jgi:hypothetical protein
MYYDLLTWAEKSPENTMIFYTEFFVIVGLTILLITAFFERRFK